MLHGILSHPASVHSLPDGQAARHTGNQASLLSQNASVLVHSGVLHRQPGSGNQASCTGKQESLLSQHASLLVESGVLQSQPGSASQASCTTNQVSLLRQHASEPARQASCAASPPACTASQVSCSASQFGPACPLKVSCCGSILPTFSSSMIPVARAIHTQSAHILLLSTLACLLCRGGFSVRGVFVSLALLTPAICN